MFKYSLALPSGGIFVKNTNFHRISGGNRLIVRRPVFNPVTRKKFQVSPHFFIQMCGCGLKGRVQMQTDVEEEHD